MARSAPVSSKAGVSISRMSSNVGILGLEIPSTAPSSSPPSSPETARRNLFVTPPRTVIGALR